MLKRRWQYWVAAVALLKVGCVLIPATAQLQKKDIVYRVQASSARAILCVEEPEVRGHVLASAPECDTLTALFTLGDEPGFSDFDAEMAAASEQWDKPAELPKNDDIMLIYFTSGTTGMPKMVTHDHYYPLGHIVTSLYWQQCEDGGLHFTISETGWAKSVWGKLYGQWLCESAVFVYDFDRFKADDLLPLFKKYNITTFCAPPTMYRFFIKEDLSRYDLSSLRYVTTAGEALNPEVFNRFYEATGLKLMEGFGQTETTLAIANLYGMTPKIGSMGKPNPQYDMDIVDENGKSVPVGETGEIVIRTDKHTPCGLFMGYYRDEEKTREAWSGGVYHTGDTAWRDEDGYFFYVGRTDDVIKSSGYRIGPFEIESVIMELPYVCLLYTSPSPRD